MKLSLAFHTSKIIGIADTDGIHSIYIFFTQFTNLNTILIRWNRYYALKTMLFIFHDIPPLAILLVSRYSLYFPKIS